MAKHTSPRGHGERQRGVHRFCVALLGGEPAMFVCYLGYVEAPDEKAAIEAAAKEFNVAEPVRDRLVARRDESPRATVQIRP